MLDASTGTWSTLWDAVNQPEQVNQYHEPVHIDLSAYQGQNIRLRWRGYNAQMDVLTYSWFIDNVKVVPTDTTNVSVGEILLDDNTVSLYPNPAKDQLHVVSGKTIRHLEVVGVNGVMIENKKVNANSLDLDLTGCSKGVYVLRLVTQDGVINKTPWSRQGR